MIILYYLSQYLTNITIYRITSLGFLLLEMGNRIILLIILLYQGTTLSQILFFPVGGSNFTLSARLSPPYSLIRDDYADIAERPEYQDNSGNPIQAEIDQARYRWLEFYKIKFDGSWYTRLFGKFVIKAQTDFGFLGTYNSYVGNIPFERFYLGGDGMQQYAMDGRETIALRGYENGSLSSRDGSIIYNKFSLELRYPIVLNQLLLFCFKFS